MTVLYTLKFDFSDFLFIINFLLFAIGLVIANFKKILQKKKSTIIATSIISGIFAVIGIFWGAMFIRDYYVKKKCLNSSECPFVQGVVENYHGMPSDGRNCEHFEIDGVYFEFNDYEITNGYHNAASKGGLITHDGQKLLIKYYYDKKNDRNFILYIAEIE